MTTQQLNNGTESFQPCLDGKKKAISYSYVHATGETFNCIRGNLKKCRVALAVWMVQNGL